MRGREVVLHAEEVEDAVGGGAFEPDGWGGGVGVCGVGAVVAYGGGVAGREGDADTGAGVGVAFLTCDYDCAGCGEDQEDPVG